MKKLFLILLLINGCHPVYAGYYTQQKLAMGVCKQFANEAYNASALYRKAAPFSKLKNEISASNTPHHQKMRILEAIDYVYNNQLNDPVIAYTTALSNCLSPKTAMAPVDDPFMSSRMMKGYF